MNNNSRFQFFKEIHQGQNGIYLLQAVKWTGQGDTADPNSEIKNLQCGLSRGQPNHDLTSRIYDLIL
jgi:hypothetical protein